MEVLATKAANFRESGKRKSITLTLTQTCNLSCIYCYEANKSGKKMSFETAVKILDKELNDDRFEEYEIDLFGGEPLLEFDLVKAIYEYTCNKYPYKLLVFSMTTNGTLAHGEIQQWLKENAERVWCSLSLDGTKEMHDINRCNSFDDIDIDFFYKTWPTSSMKMTVSPQTLPHLSEGVIYMHEHGYKFTVNLAYDIEWANEDNKALLEKELMALINYYLEHPEVEPCSFFQHPIYKVAVPGSADAFRQCGAGIEMVTYDVDGRGYPCQFFMPLSIGEEKAEQSRNIVFHNEINRDFFDEKCRDCIALTICHTCYGANYAATGNIYKKDDNMCILNKIIFKANAYFISKKVENGTFNADSPEAGYTLEAVVKLLRDFE